VYCSSSRWLGECPAHLVHWATAAVTGKQVYYSSSRCFLRDHSGCSIAASMWWSWKIIWSNKNCSHINCSNGSERQWW